MTCGLAESARSLGPNWSTWIPKTDFYLWSKMIWYLPLTWVVLTTVESTKVLLIWYKANDASSTFEPDRTPEASCIQLNWKVEIKQRTSQISGEIQCLIIPKSKDMIITLIRYLSFKSFPKWWVLVISLAEKYTSSDS